MDNLILKIDLVPRTSFYDNLRKVVTKEVWDKLRKQTYSKYKVTCGICGVKGVVLDCHEIWSYDEAMTIQKLDGLIALCKQCHQIKHYGYSNILAQQGKLDLVVLNKHFMKVNKCSEEVLNNHIDKSFEVWRKRSEKQWTINLGEYEQYVTQSERE